jgi:hypothetical protein
MSTLLHIQEHTKLLKCCSTQYNTAKYNFSAGMNSMVII